MENNKFYIYILECENGKYYTGYSIDMEKRYSLHVKGKGAKFTKINKPLRIAQFWKIRCTIGEAMKVEAFIKNKSKKYKAELIKKPSVLKNEVFQKIDLDLKFIRVNKALFFFSKKENK